MSIGAVPARAAARESSATLAGAILHPSDRVVLAALYGLIFSRQCGKDVVLLVAGAAPLSTFRAAEFVGFAAIAVAARALKDARVLSRWDLAAIGATAATLAVPSDTLGALALTLLGCLFGARRAKPLASIGQLSAGLAWIGFWGPLAMSLIAPWLLPLEAALGAGVASLIGSVSLLGNVIVADNGHRIIVATECSSFANTVRASFLWLSLLTIQGLDMRWRHVRVLAIGLAGVVALNTLRLALIAQSDDAYRFWHEGAGGSLVSAVGLTFLLALFTWGLKPARLPEG